MSELDRVVGAVLGTACGDALGAGYEFTRPTAETAIRMAGGGSFGWEPGEWTDDTAMAVAVLEVLSQGEADVDAIGERFLAWYRSSPKDVGNLTSAVLGRATTGADLPAVAAAHFERHPQSAAGNGALMRTVGVALFHLDDDAAMVRTALAVAELTHADPLAGDSCVLWCIAIARAIRHQRLDGVRDGLAFLPEERREQWRAAIDQAENRPVGTFVRNGFTVTALQAAHAAIVQTPIPEDRPALHLQHALEAAVRIGDDTDTVAAIAGMVLGARWGVSAIPFRWRRLLHGWGGETGDGGVARARDLVRLAVQTANQGRVGADRWPVANVVPGEGHPPYLVTLPGDDGVLLGNLTSLGDAVDEVDAVVSLCRVGRRQIPSHLDHHEIWLVDRADPSHNPNLDLVLDDAVEAVRTLREKGKRVFLHCVGGRSRTPMVAAAYLAEITGTTCADALQQVAAAIPLHDPHNTRFLETLEARDRSRR
jgi:ADP-ribosyl-[dinitrogen reductase] hydrolase